MPGRGKMMICRIADRATNSQALEVNLPHGKG